METVKSKEAYLEQFSGSQTPSEKQKFALEQALETRKFEIELYWRRSAYFWTFIAAAFAGFFLLSKPSATNLFEIHYLVSCIGFVFSIGWYFVIRGSKAWQRNWEAHVDLLENEIMGPLYKMGQISNQYSLTKLTTPYPFSVSGINQILSLFIIFIWFYLILYSLSDFNFNDNMHWFSFFFITAIVLLTLFLMLKNGVRTPSKNELKINLKLRKYFDSEHN